MSAQKCSGCTNQLRGATFLHCYRCSHKFHYTCLNYSRQDYNGFSKDFKDSWVCPSCRCKEPKTGDNSNTPIRSTTTTPTEKLATGAALVTPQPPPAPAVTEPEHNYVTERIKPHNGCSCSCISADTIRDILREELDRKFNVQLKDFQLKIASFEETVASHLKQNEQLSRENESHKILITELQKDNDILCTSHHDLTHRLQILDQLSRTNNIEVQCVPENKSENIYNTIEQLGKVIKCPVAESEYCSRIAKLNNKSPHPRSILVKFSSRRLRDNFLASVVKFNRNNPKEKLNTSHLGIGGQKNSPVYVTEHLTPETKSVHAAARRTAHQLSYKFVWVRDGKVFLRKSETSSFIQVRNEEALKSLI